MGWLIGSLLVLFCSVMLRQVASVSLWPVVASAIAVAAGIGAMARASRLKLSDATAASRPAIALGQNQVVRLAELDGSSRVLLQRAMRATDQVLSHLDSTGTLPDHVEHEIELHGQEWTLAVGLREATRLRAKCDADPATTSGSKARRDLETAQEQATAWVRELEGLAADSKDANIADERHQGMTRAGQLNDEGLSLTASVETDARLAIERIREFRDDLADRRKFLEAEIGDDE